MRTESGFTLLELVVSAVVLAVAILATALSIVNVSDMSELSREKMTATADADKVLEAMRFTANGSLATLKSTDWTAWATTNVMGIKGANESQLPQEIISATFPNPNDNPVQVVLTVNWTHKQRPYSYQITTLMTDRT